VVPIVLIARPRNQLQIVFSQGASRPRPTHRTTPSALSSRSARANLRGLLFEQGLFAAILADQAHALDQPLVEGVCRARRSRTIST
jgi:hypothetical protein